MLGSNSNFTFSGTFYRIYRDVLPGMALINLQRIRIIVRPTCTHTHTRMTDVYADLSTGPKKVLETTHCKRRHENNYLNIHNIFGNSVCIEEGRFVGVCCTHSHYEHWRSRIRDVSRRKACAILDWKEMGLCCPFSSVDATQLRADATRASQIGTPLALRYVSCCSQIQCRP